MSDIQHAQSAIERALSQAFSWSVDHWLVIGICVFGVYAFLAFISEIGKRSR